MPESRYDQALAAAIGAAQVAMLNHVRMLAAYEIPRERLADLDPGELPPPAAATLETLLAQMTPVASLLARAEGDDWGRLPAAKKSVYLAVAYERVMDSPAPEVPHASGVRPISGLIIP